MALEEEKCLRIFRCSVRRLVVARRSSRGVRYSRVGLDGFERLSQAGRSLAFPLFPFVRGKNGDRREMPWQKNGIFLQDGWNMTRRVTARRRENGRIRDWDVKRSR